MEIEVIEKSNNKLVFKLKGEDHTIANLLIGYLKRIDGVKRAYYDIHHPLTGVPEITVLTDGSISPSQAMKTAIEHILNDLYILEEKYNKSLEG
jgi:DNA-directed RNA polymerase subunit L